MARTPTRWSDRLRRALRTPDAGLTLAETLVAMGLVVILFAVGITLLGGINHAKAKLDDETTVENSQLNATDALYQDVTSAVSLVDAEADKMVVDVVRARNGSSDPDQPALTCERRTWQVTDPVTVSSKVASGVTWRGANLTVTTERYSSPSCSGGFTSTTSQTVIANHDLTQLTPFSFYTKWAPDTPMSMPAQPSSPTNFDGIDDVASMKVDVTSQSPAMTTNRPLVSGAAFGKFVAPGSGVVAQQAKAPILRVVTTAAADAATGAPARDAGVSAPVLSWTDSTANIAAGWAVFALRYPTGTPDGTRGQYQQVGYVINGDPSQLSQTLTWTDNDLPAGSTGQYVVAAVSSAQKTGPDSNMVTTGLRPAAPTLTVKGKATEIDLSWTAPAGAGTYDVYRDGTLYASLGNVTSWVDPTGVANAHVYEVVASNRWEAAWWCGSDSCRASLGIPDSSATGQTGSKRVLSNKPSAWTAPIAPTAVHAANRTQPDTTVDLGWTAPTWVGDATTVAAAKAAVRYQVDRSSTHVRTGLNAVSTTDTGAPRGATSGWVVSASTVAGTNEPAFDHLVDSSVPAASASTSMLTWPGAPTCTASLNGGGQPSTRAATITSTGPSGQTVSGHHLKLSADGSTQTANSAAWTQLSDGTAYTWNAQAYNAAGNGPYGANCGVTTDPLRISIASTSASTRTITASASATNGTSRNITLEGVSTIDGTSGSWDPLHDGTGFTVTARNTDGYNNAVAQKAVSTATLPAPAAPSFATPTCSGSAAGLAPTTLSWSKSSGSDWAALPTSAPTAGTYTAQVTRTETATNTDGYNTKTSSTTHNGSCSVTVSAPIHGGASSLGGAQDAKCAPHADDGAVRQDLYTFAESAVAAAYGSLYSLDGGLPAASEYALGYTTATTYTCSFYYLYSIYNSSGVNVGTWGAAIGEVYSTDGGGPVVN